MDNGMQKNALLLEQCRDEMKTLSIRGDKALRDALFQADKQVRDCTREYKQAERALNLTTEQQHTVEEVYANGKERLALAMAAEDDARIAAETVTRMIDDASTVCNMANKDTIKIMKRANDVLLETARRAQGSYEEKKHQRDELAAALERLGATQLNVQYTVAKAELNCSEKSLVKLISEYRQDVCKAQYDAICQENKYQLLIEQRDTIELQIADLQNEIKRIKDLLQQYDNSDLQIMADAEPDLIACAENTQNTISHIEVQIEHKEESRLAAEADLQHLKDLYAEKCLDCEAAEADVDHVAQAGEQRIAASRDELSEFISMGEQKLAELQDTIDERKLVYDDCIVKLDEDKAEANRLNTQLESFKKRVEEVRAEQKSAADAAETSARLADNAIKVRSSISSDSSELLRHAQEVLLEAAEAARQLSEEKTKLLKSAEHEYELVLDLANTASEKVAKTELLVQEAQLAHEQAIAVLEEERSNFSALRNNHQLDLNRLMETAEQERIEAGKRAAIMQDAVAAALQKVETAQTRLAEIGQEIASLNAQKDNAVESGERELAAIHTRIDMTKAAINEKRIATQDELSSVEQQLTTGQSDLEDVVLQISNTGDAIGEAYAVVEQIISTGVLAIISAEEKVSACRYKEDVARRALADSPVYASNPDTDFISSHIRPLAEAQTGIETAVADDVEMLGDNLIDRQDLLTEEESGEPLSEDDAVLDNLWTQPAEEENKSVAVEESDTFVGDDGISISELPMPTVDFNFDEAEYEAKDQECSASALLLDDASISPFVDEQPENVPLFAAEENIQRGESDNSTVGTFEDLIRNRIVDILPDEDPSASIEETQIGASEDDEAVSLMTAEEDLSMDSTALEAEKSQVNDILPMGDSEPVSMEQPLTQPVADEEDDVFILQDIFATSQKDAVTDESSSFDEIPLVEDEPANTTNTSSDYAEIEEFPMDEYEDEKYIGLIEHDSSVEKLEYTQRLERISSDMIDRTMQLEPVSVTDKQPLGEKRSFSEDWLQKLLLEQVEQEEREEQQSESDSIHQIVQPGEEVFIQEAVLHSNASESAVEDESAVDDDADKKADNQKKRRFLFF